ncbi:hemolysin family protein [Liquorilactobacillus hordei]|uniref:Ion Mg(2+) C(O2+) transport protein n=1 Tax=Liquorilactobacillus hordei DSM 19519 TaxID=1423759 RepID=A0A0R1MS43_9LACO|nr:hemolysin family protein [Liquorilactobacillus hordei]KRL07211.1 ion Mg(2+) C(o2+) transport protein [Liquorilactobacillus hordei DSM 19519]QYH52880.1 HlyC/CorC family transporter [Liquorilactobacillus hordei DSM 19519]
MNSEPGLVGSLLMGIAIVLLFNAGIILSIIRNYQLFDRIEQHNERITSFKKIRTGVSFSFVFLLVVGALLSVIAASKLKMIVMENSILVFLIISVILTIFPIFIADVLEKVYKKNGSQLFFHFLGYTIIIGYLFMPFQKLHDMVMSNKNGSASFDEEGNITPVEALGALISPENKENELRPEAFDMIKGVLSMREKLAKEVMVPRTDAFMIDIQNDNDRNIDAILQMQYSRIPVYNEGKDDIVGIVHIKNILKTAREEGFDHITIRKVMQPALFIPETMAIDEVMLEMKKTQNQLAILFDEYGGVVGLVTLEDLLEEIVGEIDDESDQPEQDYHKISDSEFIVQGKLSLDDFNDEFMTNFEMNDVDTIAGFMIAKLGYIPEDDSQESVEIDGIKLITEKVDDSRIMEIKIELTPALAIAHVQREKRV